MPTQDPIAIWRRPERSGVGPKPKHTRAAIAAAAIAIADQDGIEAVSIRRLASGLGSGTASLYRYLKSHDELIELMVDTVSGEYNLDPSGESPRDQLLGLARQGREIMHRHPWLAPILLTRPSLGPNTLAYLERALVALGPVQILGPAKMQLVAMLTALTSAFVQNELARRVGSETPVDGSAERLEYLSEAIRSGRYPQLAQVLGGQHTAPGPEAMFTELMTNHLKGAGL